VEARVPPGRRGRPGLPTAGPHVILPADPRGVAPSLAPGVVLDVGGEAGHHLGTVLRVRRGEPVSLADGGGVVAQGIVGAVARGQVEVEVSETFVVPADEPRLTVVQGLPKGRKLDEVVQRLCELGVDRLVPAATARAVKQVDGGGKADRVHARWQAIAVAASQQSRRARVMVVEPVSAWPSPSPATGVVLWEEAEEPLAEVLDRVLPAASEAGELVVAIGPEGGLDRREVEASGLAPAALGSTILRTETAAVVGAALVLHHLGRLG
jgi:16S rRNA (uracil1498-N3)-methyltransferase